MNKNFGGGVDLGALYRVSSHGLVEPNTRTQSRIRSMQDMLSSLPGATLVEVDVLLAGWDAGAKWQEGYDQIARDTAHCCNTRLETGSDSWLPF